MLNSPTSVEQRELLLRLERCEQRQRIQGGLLLATLMLGAFFATRPVAISQTSSQLQAEITALTNGYPATFLTGCNVWVQSGQGKTNDASLGNYLSGLGNVIIGYYEKGNMNGDRGNGSHNLIVGSKNSYSSYGGALFGSINTLTATASFSSVTGGWNNVARFACASVSGCESNTASGDGASVSGSSLNTAYGEVSSVRMASRHTPVARPSMAILVEPEPAPSPSPELLFASGASACSKMTIDEKGRRSRPYKNIIFSVEQMSAAPVTSTGNLDALLLFQVSPQGTFNAPDSSREVIK